MADSLWLIGMMGSGKSSLGRALAERMGRGFVDTDDVVTRRIGCSIAEFWGEHGEAAFRDMEAAAVAEIAAGRPRIVATGGGVVLAETNVAAMRSSGFVVWLRAEPATLAERVTGNARRPLLRDGEPVEKLAEILEERSHRYEAAAHAVVATDGLEMDTVIDRIEELWNEF
jgi:shikimate kinase